MRIRRTSLIACNIVLVGLCLIGFESRAASSDAASCRRQSDTVTIGTFEQAEEVSMLGVVPLARLDTDHDAWPGGVIELTDSTGDAVDGDVEVVAGRFAVFRPSAPLIDGAAYQVMTSGVHIRQLFRDPIDGGANNEIRWSFVSVDEALATVGQGDIDTSQVFRQTEDLTRGSLVCCDGAYPQGTDGMVCFDVGLCGSTSGMGSIELEIIEATTAPATARANSFARQLGDERIVGSDRCYDIEVMSLTTNTTSVVFERCHPSSDGQLGDLELDPLPALLERCAEQPYVCDVDDDGEGVWRWDRDACEGAVDSEDIPDHGEQDEDHGDDSGCSVHPENGAPLHLALTCFGFVLACSRRWR